jgi:hypothetical protein
MKLTEEQLLEIIMLSVKNIAIEYKMAGIQKIFNEAQKSTPQS